MLRGIQTALPKAGLMVQPAAAAARSACRERQKAGLVLLILFCTAADAAERPREGSARLLLDAGADQARDNQAVFKDGPLALLNLKHTHTHTHTHMAALIHAAHCWQHSLANCKRI